MHRASHHASQKHQLQPSPPSGTHTAPAFLVYGPNFQQPHIQCRCVYQGRAGCSPGSTGGCPQPQQGAGCQESLWGCVRPNWDISPWVVVSWAELGPGPCQGGGQSIPLLPSWLWKQIGKKIKHSDPDLAAWAHSTQREIIIFSRRHVEICLILYGSVPLSLLRHSPCCMADCCPSRFALSFISLPRRTISVGCLDFQALSLNYYYYFWMYKLLCNVKM